LKNYFFTQKTIPNSPFFLAPIEVESTVKPLCMAIAPDLERIAGLASKQKKEKCTK
jgi:hypothetical protein